MSDDKDLKFCKDCKFCVDMRESPFSVEFAASPVCGYLTKNIGKDLVTGRSRFRDMSCARARRDTGDFGQDRCGKKARYFQEKEVGPCRNYDAGAEVSHILFAGSTEAISCGFHQFIAAFKSFTDAVSCGASLMGQFEDQSVNAKFEWFHVVNMATLNIVAGTPYQNGEILPNAKSGLLDVEGDTPSLVRK